MNIKKLFFCFIFCVTSVMMLAGCSGGKTSDEKSEDMIDPSSIEADVLYLYDVKSNAVKAGEEWSEDGSEGFWLPISDEVYAEFQDPDCVGAWSPQQYFGSNELKKGFEDGVIGFGSKFTWKSGEDGKITDMYEQNYYENMTF